MLLLLHPTVPRLGVHEKRHLRRAVQARAAQEPQPGRVHRGNIDGTALAFSVLEFLGQGRMDGGPPSAMQIKPKPKDVVQVLPGRVERRQLELPQHTEMGLHALHDRVRPLKHSHPCFAQRWRPLPYHTRAIPRNAFKQLPSTPRGSSERGVSVLVGFASVFPAGCPVPLLVLRGALRYPHKGWLCGHLSVSAPCPNL